MAMRKRNSITGQFAARPIAMLESLAFRALSLGAHRVLARIEIEYAHHGGNDNGKLPVTYANFVEYGLDPHAVGPAIREAAALGFIEFKKGCAGNANFRRPNLFRLCYRNGDGAQKPTDEWRRFEPREGASAKDVEDAAEPVKSVAAEARRNKARRQVQKLKPNGGKRLPQMGENASKSKSPMGETRTTGVLRNPTVLSISRDVGVGQAQPNPLSPAPHDAIKPNSVVAFGKPDPSARARRPFTPPLTDEELVELAGGRRWHLSKNDEPKKGIECLGSGEPQELESLPAKRKSFRSPSDVPRKSSNETHQHELCEVPWSLLQPAGKT